MAKSARRRNTNRTVRRKKRGTNGYRRRTMRIRQKGGVITKKKPNETRVGDAIALDSDTESEISDGNLTPPSSPHPAKVPQVQVLGPSRKSVDYNIKQDGLDWVVSIFNNNNSIETFRIPDSILKYVKSSGIMETMLG